MEVLLVERGAAPGTKNVTGGRLYTHALDRLFPEGWDRSVLERRVTRERISFITPDSTVTVDFHSAKLGENAYTVLRPRLDDWLAEQAEAAGAMLAAGVRVDGLLREGGRVVGIRAGEDELLADVVIIAEGAGGLLTRQAGLGREPDPRQMAVGVKMTFELPADAIEERFGVAPGEGAAQLFVGSISRGLVGGGFLYTNRESLSLGLVLTIQGLRERRAAPAELLAEFQEHPSIAPLLDGAVPAEYAAHMVPEGGFDMVGPLAGDGVLVAGDAAGFALNLGYTVRGMDFAIASGIAAGEAAVAAREAGDFSRAGLAGYEARLHDSFVLRDLKHYRSAPAFMASTPRLFTAYPALLEAVMTRLFTVDGSRPPAHLMNVFLGELKGRASLWELGMDAWKGMRAL